MPHLNILIEIDDGGMSPQINVISEDYDDDGPCEIEDCDSQNARYFSQTFGRVCGDCKVAADEIEAEFLEEMQC